jgi:hypothetical protein
MINSTTDPRDARSLANLDAVFRSVHWLSADRRSAPEARNQSPVAVLPAAPQADARAAIASICADLGFAPGDPACVGLGTSNARTARAAANISDWLTYLPRDCVRAMVKEGWHWSA